MTESYRAALLDECARNLAMYLYTGATCYARIALYFWTRAGIGA